MTMFLENVRLALFGLKANKMRALLTMLGIIIGISSVIAIMTVGNSLTSSFSDSMLSLGANNVSVYLDVKETEDETTEEGYIFKNTDSSLKLTEDDFITNEMIENFVETYPEEIYAISLSKGVESGTITRDKNTASVEITGASVGRMVSDNVELVAGRVFTSKEMDEGKEIGIISEKAVEKLFDGDNEAALGETLEIASDSKIYYITIVGVAEYEESSMAGLFMGSDVSTTLYIPLKTAQNYTHSEGYTSFDVILKNNIDPDEFAKKAKSFFLSYYKNNRILTVDAMSMASLVDTLSEMMDKITMAISIIAGIALLVGGIGVMNIMLVSITERTREIGTRKALGAPNSSIRLQFIIEAVVICLIGGIIGVSLGIGLGMLFANLMDTPAAPSLSSIIGSLGFSMGIGVFFGYYTANKAAKMDPIEALRYE